MKADRANAPQELELKLALLSSDSQTLYKQLCRIPVLARRESTKAQLRNVYFDTPEQTLRQARIALRTRSVMGQGQQQWLQTLKTAGSSDSALSLRGEWETPVVSQQLSLAALQGTPWSDLDPDGSLFSRLQPCFTTHFERITWQVRRRDGSLIEVALDLGSIEADGQAAPICELELELISGKPQALLDIAAQVAQRIATLPASRSKAERGYALASHGLHTAWRANLPKLTSSLPALTAAQKVLLESFNQFTNNLIILHAAPDPEVVHQARVGWRRFKSALKFFKPLLSDAVPTDISALRTVLDCLGQQRDHDVALLETLPSLAEVYIAADAKRQALWQASTLALAATANQQREALRFALTRPAVGSSLLAITGWLDNLATNGPQALHKPPSLKAWSRHRVIRQQAQLHEALTDQADTNGQHRARILAKRLRYGIEALSPLLARQQREDWYQQAIDLQTSLGRQRDIRQAFVLLQTLPADPALLEFLRGFCAGLDTST
jgi:inorganic triphosphatase YgiF